MHRSQKPRPVALAVVLGGISIGLVCAALFITRPGGTDTDLMDPIAAIALVVLGLLLTYYLGRWLANRSTTALDGTLIIVLFVFIFALISAAVIFLYPNDSLAYTVAVLVTTSAVCLSLLSFAKKQFNIQRREVIGGAVAVVRRRGVFNRFENPGSIWLWGNSEEIAYTLPTTDQVRQVDTGILHMGALAYGYRLRAHFRLAPEQLIDPDDNKLQNLHSPTDVFETIREALKKAVQQAEQTYDAGTPETYQTDWFGSLLRIRPYTPMRKTFLNTVNLEMAKALKPKGIEWDSERELVVEALQLPHGLINALTPAEYDRLLAEHNTNLDSAARTELYTWITKADPLDIPFDFSTPRNHSYNDVDPVPKPRKSRPKPVKIPPPSLSDEDLSIMKRIPGSREVF